MHRRCVFLLGTAAAALLIAGCGGDSSAGEPVAEPPATGAFDEARAFEDLRFQVDLGPRPAGSTAAAELADWAVAELEEAGVENVTVQSPHRNIVGFIAGNQPGVILIGAHYDTKDSIEGFVGANDGASGVAVVLELARALAAAPNGNPSIAIALFDGEESRGSRPFEEDGLRGSFQYAELAKEGDGPGYFALEKLTAMVLFDMVGDCDLQIPRELSSDRDLYERFEQAGAELLGAASPFGGMTDPIGDDHVPFLAAGVPALDLIDFTYGGEISPGPYWHTDEDTLDKVCPGSLDAVGEVALRAIPTL